MIVYVVMRHEFFSGGDSEVDSVWLKESDAVAREDEINNEKGYCGSVEEMEAQ